jgi:cytoskeletal protein CcmA (bactofilin family)
MPTHTLPVREAPASAVFAEPVSSNVGESIILRGDVSSEEDIRIEGQVIGSIRSSGTVFVLASGNVYANISADSVVIDGVVRGNLDVANRIDVCSNGTLEGDAQCARIAVADGAYITGKIETRGAQESHDELAVEGSRLAEELDRIAELDIAHERYTTLKGPASLEELSLRRRSMASQVDQRQAVVKSY